jgi:ABC-type transport system involved in multi-copper enzyme maturation permease subunit
MKLLRAWLTLVWLSFARLLWSTATLVVCAALAFCALYILRSGYDSAPDLGRSFENFSAFIMTIYLSAVVPLSALAFGTSAMGNDREDRTLLFVLMRPIPPALVLLARWVAALPLGLGVTVASFGAYCWLAGEVGALAWRLYLPAVFWTMFAYLGLFHLLAVLFRHATIVAIAYTIFIEIILGSMPGIVKRVAVNYYGKSLMFTAGAAEGLQPPDARTFELLASSTAEWVLVGIGLGSLAIAAVIFTRREY